MTEIVKNNSIFENAPSDWVIDRIKNRLDAIVGGEWGDDPGTDLDGLDIAVIRVADIDGIIVNKNDLTIRNIQKTKLLGRLITEKSLLIEKSGGGEKQSVGRAAYPGKLDFDAVCSNFMAKLECGCCAVPSFLNYLFFGLYNRGVNQAAIKQTTGIQNLDCTAYLSTKVAFPKNKEQSLISNYLDKQCAAIDKVLEAKREQLTVLEELRKSIIHKAVTKGLDDSVEMKDSGIEWIGKIPAKWKVARLKDYSDINKQSLGEETEPDFSFYYIDIGNVDYEKGYEKKELIEFSSAPSRARRKVEQGDTIVSTVRTYLKAIAYVHESGEDIVVSTGFAVVSPRRPLVMDKFLNHYLRSHFVIEKISSLSTGVGYPAIDSTRLSCIPIIIPSKEEQVAISEYLDAQCKRIMNLRERITQQIETLGKYRQSLIHECVTGKRRITEKDLKELANV